MATSETEAFPNRISPRVGWWFLLFGALFLTLSFGITVLTFLPVLREEVKYQTTINTKKPQNETVPVDASFGIVIPKLGANARIIPNVDPYDGTQYQKALAQGVAHARGTVFPGQPGNIFLFSHSSVDFYRATQFNSVFYLIHKLEAGDMIELYYQNRKFTYRVTGKKTVESTAVSYLTTFGSAKTLTLMTCWPPGTALRRLLVFAEITNP